MEKAWKQQMRYNIREWIDLSQGEDENYDTIIDKVEELDGVFVDPSDIDKEDVKQLGGSTKLANLVEMYDDLSKEKQNEVWWKIEELIKEYHQILMDEEEDWIRHKIRQLLKME